MPPLSVVWSPIEYGVSFEVGTLPSVSGLARIGRALVDSMMVLEKHSGQPHRNLLLNRGTRGGREGEDRCQGHAAKLRTAYESGF